MEKLINFVEKLLSSNLDNSPYKYVYLYGELFISIFKDKEFVLFWLVNKSGNLIINKYSWWNEKQLSY